MKKAFIVFAIMLTASTVFASNYGDAMGQYFGRFCDTRTLTCQTADFELAVGGTWMVYCNLTLANGYYTYPCFYDIWYLKGEKIFLSVGGKEMYCEQYGQNKGLACMYDTTNILTGVRAK